MLYPVNDYLLYIIQKETTERFRREAEVDHLIAELYPRQSNWLAQQMCWALHHVGHVLMNLGERLERFETSSVA